MSKIFRFLLGGDKEEDKKNDQNNSTPEQQQQQEAASSQQPVAEPPKTPQKLSSTSGGNETLSAEEMRLRRLRMYGAGSAQPATSPPQQQSPSPAAAAVTSSSSKPIEIKSQQQQSTTQFLKPEEPKKAASFQEPSNISPQQVSKPVAVSLSPAKALPTISSKPEFMSTSPMEVSPLGSEPFSEKRKTLNAEEKLIHEGVMKIFRVTLQGKTKSSFEFLANMYSHLVNTGQSTHFTDDLTESVIVERMNLPFEENQTSLTYLLGCYTRCNDEIQKESKRKEKKEVVIKALEHMKRLIVSYFGIVLLDDGLFPKQPMTKEEGPLQLIPFLLAETSFTSTNMYDMSDDFFGEFIEKTSPQDLQQIFTPIFTELSKRIANMTLVNRVIPILTAVVRLLRFKELAKIMVSHPNWLPNIKTGKALELFSLLGPFFTLTTYYDKPAVAEKFFGQATRLSQQAVNQATATLRSDLKGVYDNLHKMVYLLLKDKETREPAIQWLAIAVEGNRLRSRMQDDFISSSSEGFMTNLCAVLLKLSEPFLDVKKLTINPDFPMLNTLVNFKEDVKLKASEKEAIEWYEKNKKNEKKEFAFTTQCFFLAYRALKLGYLKTVEKYHRVLQSIREAQRELERANKHGSLPPYELQKLREEIDKLLVIRWGAEAALLDPQLHSMIFKFYNYASAWLVSKADPQGKGYPLQAPPPMEWCCLPEFLVDNIADFLLFVSKLAPTSVVGAPMEEINNLMVMLVGNGQFVQNPYIRAKFPEVWVSFIPPSDEKIPLLEQNATIVFNYKMLRQNLMNGILQLYVDMEHTGASTQFYDKFTPRYYISIMLKYLWVDRGYKESFIKETQRNNAKEFLRFFNMLLNDAIYLLDESLKHLQEIRQYQTDRADTSFWNGLPENQQREREMNNVQAERRVTNYMLLAKEYVHMLSYLSRDDPEPFLRPEMRDRVAAMLNYFLVELGGPTCQNLKVKNAEKYHFDPKYLLTEITDTYVHFSKFEEFTKAVANDERSFRPEVFERVAQILRKIGRRPESYIKEFEAFAVQAMEQAEKAMHVDQDLGEAPEEFLDPITYTIMADPVKLPASGVIVDRATIERHLLNDQKDPFNRSPLTVEDLVPLPELKQQIEQWKNSKTKH